MRIHSHWSFVLALALASGTTSPAFADESADRAALDAATQAWAAAYNARDADAMAVLTTEDVALLASNTPIRGRDAVHVAWRQATAAAKTQATVTIEETVIAKDYAWQSGNIFYALPNGHVLSRARIFDIWKRVGDQWKLHRRMVSNEATTARTKSKPRPAPNEPVLDTPGN